MRDDECLQCSDNQFITVYKAVTTLYRAVTILFKKFVYKAVTTEYVANKFLQEIIYKAVNVVKELFI